MEKSEKETPMTDLGFRESTSQRSRPKYPLKRGSVSGASQRASPPNGKLRIHLRIDPPDVTRLYRSDIAVELVSNGKAEYA
jgi:hypothetical protein